MQQIKIHSAFIAIIIALTLLCACHDRHSGPTFVSKSAHTLLIYIEGDNSLSHYADINIRSCMDGLLKSDNPLNLVVYKDNNSGKPALFQLKRSSHNASKIDTVYIQRWTDDIDSSSPEVISEVINMAFSKFDADVRGIDFWSHGMSWIPSDSYKPSRMKTYFGQDGNNYTELWDLRRALEQVSYPVDYLMFDACHMATAEVLYELRNTCQYILASPTEIMGDGFPYADMLSALSDAQTPDQLLPSLQNAYEWFASAYSDNGTFSLLSTDGAEELYDACRDIYRNADVTAKAEDAQYVSESIQRYGRKRTYALYYFHDALDWGNNYNPRQSEDDIARATALRNAIERCVLRSYYSRRFTDGKESLTIINCCGLALSVPEIWPLTETLTNNKGEIVKTAAELNDAYTHLQWQL
ncbi:MAG: hypothetical protein KBT20_01650 [Bacteroidales bacterium]|nr:hypothetical protein [Candidatus Liminaster caballi]